MIGDFSAIHDGSVEDSDASDMVSDNPFEEDVTVDNEPVSYDFTADDNFPGEESIPNSESILTNQVMIYRSVGLGKSGVLASGSNNGMLTIFENFVVIQGSLPNSIGAGDIIRYQENSGTDGILINPIETNSNLDLTISNCIIRGTQPSKVANKFIGIRCYNPSNFDAAIQIWNNIIYGFEGSVGYQVDVSVSANDRGIFSAYNNTIAKSTFGIVIDNMKTMAINNLIYGCATVAYGNFVNLTTNATDASTLIAGFPHRPWHQSCR